MGDALYSARDHSFKKFQVTTVAKRKAATWAEIIGCDVTIQFKNNGDHNQFFKNVLPVLLETDLSWELRMVQDIRIFAINVRSNANKKQWQEVLEPLLSKTSLNWKVIPATELTEGEAVQQLH